ncbi:DUF3784 domain-containing protein [Cytobacillus oceanisediminis]|jgi:hypothetical protein|uniref:DUF3784 domain-containing protein n=1 Tax=Cytobacillus oceanisediminis TaxID=665099 RepID=UPI001C232FE4|nr:DUF3784 domain-containing protein [Cytobacillus oceanisediminis]MBU8768721.1 DUF3784 domain-containing protein [Cytobacillus oceanisediminis]MCM3395975.1 DUF3784 domain-containing protein [Cytobacillus oceanisediminis]
MDLNLIIFGILFLVLGYLIGVKKQTWLLSGFNEKRVKNKKKLAHLVGGTLAFLSIILIIGGIIGWLTPEYFMIFVVAVMLGLIFYVNIMLVE